MSVNKVILLGNLTSDPQVRVVGQSQVATFGLATNERFKKADGTIVENTEFHNIELWGNTGVIQYLRKGTQSRYPSTRWQQAATGCAAAAVSSIPAVPAIRSAAGLSGRTAAGLPAILWRGSTTTDAAAAASAAYATGRTVPSPATGSTYASGHTSGPAEYGAAA